VTAQVVVFLYQSSYNSGNIAAADEKTQPQLIESVCGDRCKDKGLLADCIYPVMHSGYFIYVINMPYWYGFYSRNFLSLCLVDVSTLCEIMPYE
jgi:hypothetical protein